MRRTTALAVDTSNEIQYDNVHHELSYDHKFSPRSSIYSQLKPIDEHLQVPPPPPPPSITISPSIRLLFSQLSSRHRLFILLPAILSSLLSGAIAPFMTLVVGQAFNAFAQFPLTPNPPQSAKNILLHKVGIAALELLALAIGSFVLGSVTSSLWIWTGERNVMALRKRVYSAVTRKDMIWFDTKMGAEATVQSADGEQGPLGAGGLMSKFTRFVLTLFCSYSSYVTFSPEKQTTYAQHRLSPRACCFNILPPASLASYSPSPVHGH
jgi:ATP-binding cassette subfamily B (MDR/TAP) protein 1